MNRTKPNQTEQIFREKPNQSKNGKKRREAKKLAKDNLLLKTCNIMDVHIAHTHTQNANTRQRIDF